MKNKKDVLNLFLIPRFFVSLKNNCTQFIFSRRVSFNNNTSPTRNWIYNGASGETAALVRRNYPFSFKPFLSAQNLFVFVVVLFSFFALANFFIPKPQISESQIIKDFTTKQSSAVVAKGQPVKWTILVNRNQIKQSQNLVQIPKDAKNIKITTVSTAQANQLLAQQPLNDFNSEQRKQLADTKPSKPRSIFAKLSGVLLANVNEAINQIVETITPAPENEEIIQTSDASYVDLSGQIPIEELVEQPTVELQSELQGQTPQESPQESLLQTISPSDQEVIASDSEAIPSIDQEIASPSSTDSARNDEELKIAIEEEKQKEKKEEVENEFVEISYETPAPQITEQATDTGKLVTVSDPNEDPQVPLVDVLASTNIPEIFKVGQESKIKIKWQNNNDQEMEFHAYDLNENGKLDYVEWTVPHLSEQTFEIIYISKAFKLDQDKNIIEDIYDTVKTQDNNWAPVENNQYVRVTFEQILDDTKDNTIYARPIPGVDGKILGAIQIEVYPVYTDQNGNTTEGPLVAVFENIDHEDTYNVLLTNLQTPTDVFDLRVIPAKAGIQGSGLDSLLQGNDSGGVDIDFIVDPIPATVTDNFSDSTKIASSTNITVAGGAVALSASSSWTCGSSLVDSRDGKIYTTVLIGSQCWMRQNLNVGTKITTCTNGYSGGGVCTSNSDTLQNQGTSCSSIQKYCYLDTESNCTTYGGLYQWNQMMCGLTATPATGICPTGWHLPTDAEYITLEEYLGMCTGIGTPPNYCSGDSGQWRGTTQGTTLKTVSASTFSGLLPGYRNTDGSFIGITSYAAFWSSVQSGGYAWLRYLDSGYATVYRGTYDKAYGFSVRCLKD